MATAIAALLSLGIVLVVLGAAIKAAFGNATILKAGGILLLIALLPALTVGLFTGMSAATPNGGGSSSLGSLLAVIGVIAIVSVIAYLYLMAKGVLGGKRNGDGDRGGRRGGYRLDDSESED